MKNILIPTDLTIQSLWPIQKMVENANGEQLNIHLVHVLYIPTDFYDLLSVGKTNSYALASENFVEAYEMLRNKHKSTINKLSLSFLYGSSKRVIINYMQGHAISEIYMLSNYRYEFNTKQSVDFIGYLKRSGVPINSVLLNVENMAEYQTLSTLLQGNNGIKEIYSTGKYPVFSGANN